MKAGGYEHDRNLLRAIIDGDLYKGVDIDILFKDQEAHDESIARQVAEEGLTEEGLSEVKADVERILTDERDAIQSEGSAGEIPNHEWPGSEETPLTPGAGPLPGTWKKPLFRQVGTFVPGLFLWASTGA